MTTAILRGMIRQMGEILITSGNNPQPEVRKNAETATDWLYHEEASRLYNLAVIFRDRLVDPILRLDRSQVPDPVISFDNLRQSRTLACYRLNRNPQGLLYEITLNTEHYDNQDGKPVWRFGPWAQAETLLHEQLHLKQQKYGKAPYKGGRVTHNKEFCTMAKQLGLNIIPVIGCHYDIADEGSPFAILMHELGIKRPEGLLIGERGKKDDWFEIGKKRKGRSSLTKWSCGCQNAWIGSAEFFAHCNVCGNDFVQATALRELANTLPPEEPPTELPKSTTLYDTDTEMHRQEEAEEFTDTDSFEDLSTYMEQYD